MRIRSTAMLAAAFAAIASAADLPAQTGANPCPGAMPGSCPVSLQVLSSALPQTGILAAGGNPVPGIESTRGITLGIIPRTTATLRVSAARIALPDLREGASPADEHTYMATAVRLGTATRLFEGVGAGPVAGIGAVDLLLDAAFLPAAGQATRSAAAFGAGARIGIVRESFGTPGVALTAMYHHVGRQEFGRICPGIDFNCGNEGNGRASYALHDVGARLTVGKRVGPLGLLGGAGWDRFSTDGGRIRYFAGGFEPTRVDSPAQLHDSRWSVFANVSYALLVGSLVAEGGWMSGGDAVPGFEASGSDFDPGKGTPFASLALRLSL